VLVEIKGEIRARKKQSYQQCKYTVGIYDSICRESPFLPDTTCIIHTTVLITNINSHAFQGNIILETDIIEYINATQVVTLFGAIK
jgi:hypothetical protein